MIMFNIAPTGKLLLCLISLTVVLWLTGFSQDSGVFDMGLGFHCMGWYSFRPFVQWF